MVITLTPDLAATLTQAASKQGTTPETLALDALRARFLPKKRDLEPRDDWERAILAIGTDCGVSLSNEDLKSERLYE